MFDITQTVLDLRYFDLQFFDFMMVQNDRHTIETIF